MSNSDMGKNTEWEQQSLDAIGIKKIWYHKNGNWESMEKAFYNHNSRFEF